MVVVSVVRGRRGTADGGMPEEDCMDPAPLPFLRVVVFVDAEDIARPLCWFISFPGIVQTSTTPNDD